MEHHYRIYVYLAGDTKMLLCTVSSPEAVGSVITTLCRAEQPEYQRVEIEIYEPVAHLK